MQKVLILSYFFPPCNLTASQRAYGWALYLKRFGYYPVIITRNWDYPINNSLDLVKSSGKEIKIEKFDSYEVHYLPYQANLRDRLLRKTKKSWFIRLLGKSLTFLELLTQNFITRILPYSSLYRYSNHILSTNKDFKAILITGKPFTLFHFGTLLSKKNNVPWIADYRDDWTTCEITNKKSIIDKLLHFLEQKSEKKWLATASGFTTISEHYKNKIQAFIGINGHVIYNGFFENDFENITLDSSENNDFTIIYNGTLYPTQPVEKFLNVFKNWIDKNEIKQGVKLKFVGLAFDTVQSNRVKKAFKGYEKFLEITARINRPEVLRQQKQAQILLMLSHNNIKGIPSSKIYEYLAIEKPILVFPSDFDVLEEIVCSYNLGKIANTNEELKAYLNISYSNFIQNRKPEVADKKYINTFNRIHQTKVLADIINGITKA